MQHRQSSWVHVPVFLTVLSSLSLYGCGGGDAPVVNNLPGTNVRAASGGTVTSAGVTLVFPPAALAADSAVTITPISTGLPANPPANAAVVPGTTYALGPDGATFSKPVTLTLPYDPANLPNGTAESNLVIYTVTNGAWTPVSGSVVDTTKKTVTAPITHFSSWGIIGPTMAHVANTLYHSLAIGADAVSSNLSVGDTPAFVIQTHDFVGAGNVTRPGYMGGSLQDNIQNPAYGVAIRITASGISAGSRYPVRPPALVNATPLEPDPGTAWVIYSEVKRSKKFYGVDGYVVIDQVDFSKNQALFHFEAVRVEGALTLRLPNESPNVLGVGIFNLDLDAVVYVRDADTL